MSAPPADPSGTLGGRQGSSALGEPVVQFARSPGTVEIDVKGLDSLFDRATPPNYPHTGPMVDRAIAKFLVDSVRERPPTPDLEVIVGVQSPLPGAAKEGAARAQMNSYFANEAEMASLERRVNRAEGLGALWMALPVLIVAGFAAGLLYATAGEENLSSLAYLVVIVIVWVALWDPIEILLFGSFFIRRRIRALRKLAVAKITFVYRPVPAVAPGPVPV